MAFSHGSVASAAIAGFDATSYLKDLSEQSKIDTAEVSVLGTVAKSYIPGMEEATIKATGFYDSNPAVNQDVLTFNYLLASLKRQITQVSYMPAGDLLGSPAFLINGQITDQTVNTATNGAAAMDFSMQSSSGFQRGFVLRPQSVQTGAIAGAFGTSVDNGAATTNGLSMIVQVFSIIGTATPTLTVSLQDSADNVTFSDIGSTSTTGFTASGSQYISTAALSTVRRYVRIKYTLTGTSPAATFGVQMARN